MHLGGRALSKNNDREHFENYRDQTRVKHEILAAYLPAYFHILKQDNQNLVYIDGFAGCGTYTKADTGEVIDGSPLRVLGLIAENKDFASRVSTIFVESDSVLFANLKSDVSDFYDKHKQIRQPVCMEGKFADQVGEVLKLVSNLAPTFLFVDPCGVSGTNFATIRDVMKNDKCEAFIFFNIDGVRRIAGLKERSPVLIDLMGSNERAQRLYDAFQVAKNVAEREELILSHYRDALREEAGVKFTIPFRVESEDKKKTSHYLIHASKHSLGFKIMKNVMWWHGQSEYDAGALEFAQASRSDFMPLFDQADLIKRAILDALKKIGSMKVAEFCDSWVRCPENLLCESAYKSALLALEESGDIEVLGKDGITLAPANTRPKRKKKPTLANDYFVRGANK